MLNLFLIANLANHWRPPLVMEEGGVASVGRGEEGVWPGHPPPPPTLL